MAFAIARKPGLGPAEFFVPGNRVQLADQTTTTAVQTLAAPAKTFAWMIYQKVSAVGTGTRGPVYTLQAADNSAFTTNVRELDSHEINPGLVATAVGFYVNPDVRAMDGAKSFVRILVSFSGTGSATFDAVIQAA